MATLVAPHGTIANVGPAETVRLRRLGWVDYEPEPEAVQDPEVVLDQKVDGADEAVEV